MTTGDRTFRSDLKRAALDARGTEVRFSREFPSQPMRQAARRACVRDG